MGNSKPPATDDPLLQLDTSQINVEEETESDPTPQQILSQSYGATRGTMLPSVEEFRDEGMFEHALSSRQIDPRFQDLRRLRAESQGFFEQAGKAGLKFIPQTAAKIAETAGYVGDFTAYDDAFRGLYNHATGQESEPGDYADMDNWLSKLARDTNTALDEMLPVYREDQQKVWAPGDSAWWVKNIGNLGESIASFAAVGAGVGGGLGFLAKGAARGMGASAKAVRGAQTASNLGANFSVSFGEGMMVGMQNYERTYQQKKQELQEKTNLRPEEIEQRANQAAGQAAATSAGLNAVLLPALNFTSMATLMRKGRGIGRLTNESLERNIGEGLEEYAKRVSQTEALEGYTSRQITDLLRESGLESVEELAAEISQVEGEAAGGLRDEDLAQRLSNALFTPQAGLAAVLGGIGGAGQQGIMRNLPTMEGEDGDLVSQNTIQKQRHEEWAHKEKSDLESRLNRMMEAKKELRDAETQAERDQALDKIRTDMTVDSIARGVEHQLVGLYEGIQGMSESQAAEQGFDTDPESPNYYKTLAQEEIRKIEEMSNEYRNLVDTYEFSSREEFAGVPETLLSLRVQERQAQDVIDEVDRQEVRLQERKDTASREAGNAYEAEENIRQLEQKNQEYQETLDELNQIDDQSQKVRDQKDLRLNLSDNLYNRIRNLPVQDAINTLERLQLDNDQDLQIARRQSENSYQNFLEATNREDTEQNRKIWENAKQQEANLYGQAIEQNAERKLDAREKLRTARERYNYITDSEGRQDLVERTQEVYEKNKEKYNESVKANLNTIESAEEIDAFLEDSDTITTPEIEEYAEQRKEQLREQEREVEYEAQEDKSKQETQDERETIVQETQEQVNTLLEETEEKEQTDDVDEQSIVDRITEALGQQTEEPTVTKDEAASFIESNLTEYINNNYRNIDPDNIRDDVESFVEETLRGKRFDPEDFPAVIQNAISLYNSKKEFERTKQDQPDEEVEVSDTPPDNVSDEVTSDDTVDEDYSVESELKTENSGSTVTYISIDYQDFGQYVTNVNNERREPVVEGLDPQTGESVELRRLPDIEHPNVANEGDNLELRVMDMTFDDGNNHVPRSQLVQKEEATDNEIDRAVIGIYLTEGEYDDFIGFLRTPQSINENTTVTRDNNVERQKKANRALRASIIQKLQQTGQNVTTKVRRKTPGKLSINYKKDENGEFITKNGNLVKEPQTVAEGFPNQDRQFFVIRGEEPYVRSEKAISPDSLLNKNEYFQKNEGTSGIIVEMGNGERLAVPIWLPTLDRLDTEFGENVVDTLYETMRMSTSDNPVVEGEVDLSNPQELKDQISNYVYTTSRGPYDLVRNYETPQVHVVVNSEGDVYVVNQKDGNIYTNNEQVQRSEPYIFSLADNEPDVKNALRQMRLNVDVNKINKERKLDAPPKNMVSMSDGALVVENYDTYDDFLSQYALTDIDASYELTDREGNTKMLAYQHPMVEVDTNLVERPPASNPNIPEPTSTTDGPKNTHKETETTEDSDNQEIDQNSEVDGDTSDVYDPTDTDSAPIADPRDRWEATEQAVEEEQEIEETQEISEEEQQLRDRLFSVLVALDDVDTTDVQDQDTLERLESGVTSTFDPMEAEIDRLLNQMDIILNEVAEAGFDPNRIQNEVQEQVNQIGEEQTQGQTDPDPNLQRIAEKIVEGEDLTDLEQSIRNDYSDEIDPMIARMSEKTQEEIFEDRYDEINTSTTQDTGPLKESVTQLENLLADIESEGRIYQNVSKGRENMDANIRRNIADMRAELSSRGETLESVDKTENDLNLTDEEVDEGIDELFGGNQFNQQSLQGDHVAVQEVYTGETTPAFDVLQTQVEQDVKDGKLNIICKTT